jgi:F-type H+-transporting ATPase subunit b
VAPEFREIIPYAVNFAIVVALLFVMVRKPLRKHMYQRHERMRDSFESAAVAHKKAAARAEEAARKLAGLSGEEQGVLRRESSLAEQEKKEILEKAQAESQRILKEADRLASVEQDEASERVKEQFLDLVIHETEENLKRSLKKDDHSAILKRAQNSIEVGV